MTRVAWMSLLVLCACNSAVRVRVSAPAGERAYLTGERTVRLQVPFEVRIVGGRGGAEYPITIGSGRTKMSGTLTIFGDTALSRGQAAVLEVSHDHLDGLRSGRYSLIETWVWDPVSRRRVATLTLSLDPTDVQ